MAIQTIKSKLSVSLSVILGVIILGTIGVFTYTMLSPASYDYFTEFYVLNLYGEAAHYPDTLKVGEETGVIIVIHNLEKEQTSYHVVIRVGWEEICEIGLITLSRKEKYKGIVNFTINTPKDGWKVEFLLYKAGQTKAYESLHLWIDVYE